MKTTVLLLTALLLSGCVATQAEEADRSLVRIMVTSQKNPSFERMRNAAEPVAQKACAAEGKTASWMVSNTLSSTQTRLAYICL